MNEQTIATNMTLVVVALLAATLIVVIPTWKRLETYWKCTSTKNWPRVEAVSGLLIGIPVVYITAANISLMISIDTWYYDLPNVAIAIAFTLILVFYLYAVVRNIWRQLADTKSIVERTQKATILSPPRRLVVTMPIYFCVILRRSWRGIRRSKKKKGRSLPDISKEIGAVSALGCFVITIVLALVITMASVPIAIGVEIGGKPQKEDFEFARAMIVAMPLTLSFGLLLLGVSYVAELRQEKQGSQQ